MHAFTEKEIIKGLLEIIIIGKKRKQVMEDTRMGYWCHMCNQMVDPIMEVDTIKCPLCLGGFVEEMDMMNHHHNHQPFDSDRSLSLWAPILLGMMTNPRRRHRPRRLESSADEEDDDQDRTAEQNEDVNHHHNNHHHRQGEEEIELNREMESIVRRRRNSATILQLLQGLRAGMMQSPASDNTAAQSDVGNRNNNRDRDRVILINPFNQTIIVQSSYGPTNNPENQNQNPIGSIGDYFIGPGFDLLLRHLAENDPNRYGTPPAQKEAVEAMPTIKIEENLQCSVCLEDFDIGSEAKEMPCKHKFHSDCILPWLEMHSSCPVCRHQLPVDESKVENNANHGIGETSNAGNSSGGIGEGSNENGRRVSVPLPWPLSLFAFSDFAAANANSSSSSALSSSGSEASTNAFGNSNRADEN